jgi:DNA repair protein RecO (recombination protein O)
LTGFLPELHECIECGDALNGRAWFHPLADGLMCAEHKRLASIEMSAESRQIASEMFRAPIDAFTGAPWPRARAADLRRFLTQRVERALEKKLVSAAMLEKLD